MGSGFNAEYVAATQYQADSNVRIAQSANKTDLEIAREQSSAVKAQAKYDYDARIYEADKNFQVQMEALRVREKEANLTYRVDIKNAENDAIRAEASKIAAQARVTEADSKVLREEARAERYRSRGADGGGGGYWHGYA